jgi:hypothetical protein
VAAISDEPVLEIILGLVVAGIVVADVVTGSATLSRLGNFRRDKAPRAFWIINAFFGAPAAYLICNGVTVLAAA